MGKITTLALATSVSLSAAFAANAALLDFTDLDTFADPLTHSATSASGTIAGVAKWTLTATPITGPIKYNFPFGSGSGLGGADDGYDGVATEGSSGLKFDGDGLGIGAKDDEVTGSDEALTLTFSKAVKISGIHLLDLFYSVAGQTPGLPGAGDLFEYFDVYDTVSGALLATYKADQLLLNGDGNNGGNAIGGYKFGKLNYIGTSLTFKMGGRGNNDDGNRDAALAAVEVSAVPVPAAGFLLLTAIGGLAAARRRKSA